MLKSNYYRSRSAAENRKLLTVLVAIFDFHPQSVVDATDNAYSQKPAASLWHCSVILRQILDGVFPVYCCRLWFTRKELLAKRLFEPNFCTVSKGHRELLASRLYWIFVSVTTPSLIFLLYLVYSSALIASNYIKIGPETWKLRTKSSPIMVTSSLEAILEQLVAILLPVWFYFCFEQIFEVNTSNLYL
jgi:hypothetical protein